MAAAIRSCNDPDGSDQHIDHDGVENRSSVVQYITVISLTSHNQGQSTMTGNDIRSTNSTPE